MKCGIIVRNMSKTIYDPPPDVKELARAFSYLRNEREVVSFLRDLLTISEINEFSRRFQILKELTANRPYAVIARKFRTSTATVTRVAYWVRYGMGGYRLIIKRMFRRAVK